MNDHDNEAAVADEAENHAEATPTTATEPATEGKTVGSTADAGGATQESLPAPETDQPTSQPTNQPTDQPASEANVITGETLTGSGAGAATAAVRMTVPAGDAAAFGAALQDIAAGRVRVDFGN